MKLNALTISAAAATMLFAGQLAQAQQQDPFKPPDAYKPATYTPYQTPLISPYLNMLRPGGPAFNYFTYVQPQLEYQRAFQQLEKKVFEKEPVKSAQGGVRVEDAGLPPTGGRLPGYFTHKRFFMTQGGSATPREFVQPRYTGTFTPRYGTTNPPSPSSTKTSKLASPSVSAYR